MLHNKLENTDPKAKKSALTIAIENNRCSQCRVLGLAICKGHAAGGGGGNGGDQTETKKATSDSTNQTSPASGEVAAAIRESDKANTIFLETKLSSNEIIHYDAGLLTVESDKVRGNLTFRIKPRLSKEDLEISQQFLETVKNEFNLFKNQQVEKGHSSKNWTAALKDNELTIHIPHPTFYLAFIKHLALKNLFPYPNPKRQQEEEMFSPSRKEKQKNYQNPYSMRLEIK